MLAKAPLITCNTRSFISLRFVGVSTPRGRSVCQQCRAVRDSYPCRCVYVGTFLGLYVPFITAVVLKLLAESSCSLKRAETHKNSAPAEKQAKCPLRGVSTHDSLDGYISGTVMPEKPGPNAPADARKEYLDRQLDSLTGQVVLDVLVVQSGERNRPHGGVTTFCAHAGSLHKLLLAECMCLLSPQLQFNSKSCFLCISGNRTMCRCVCAAYMQGRQWYRLLRITGHVRSTP